MTQQINFSGHHPAVESVYKNGFDGLGESMRLLFNEAMKIERSEALKAQSYERRWRYTKVGHFCYENLATLVIENFSNVIQFGLKAKKKLHYDPKAIMELCKNFPL